MNIQEFQAKQLLGTCGINVPAGEVARTADEAREAGRRLPGSKWLVKAQICAGGRGRGRFADSTSGISMANSPDEIHACAAAMLGNTLVTAQTGAEGLPVERVYVEQAVNIERELAVSLMVDEKNRRLALLLFACGGSGIEDAAADDPDSVYAIPVSPVSGADADQLHRGVANLMLTKSLQGQLKEIIDKIIRLFCETDASLIEINPLAVSGDDLIAVDAKMTFDNNALFRQRAILEMGDAPAQAHRVASLDGFNYIPLDGDIACLAVGAGLSMATLDAIRHYGGRPANFLDLPPDSRVNRVVGALEVVLSNPNTKSLLVNVFGGGIMRCDTVSDAILLVNHSNPIRIPLAVRLSGTNSELANRRLRESAPAISLVSNLAEAAQSAVAAVERGSAVRAPVAPSWLAKWLTALRPSRPEPRRRRAI